MTIEEALKKGYPGHRQDWDLCCKCPIGNIKYIEVKNQSTCHEWEFWNCETMQNGKPGGIAVSKATDYVIVNSELGFGWIEAKKLKEIWNCIRKNESITSKSYENKEWIDACGRSLQLYRTDYKNVAYGWKHPVNDPDIKWIK